MNLKMIKDLIQLVMLLYNILLFIKQSITSTTTKRSSLIQSANEIYELHNKAKYEPPPPGVQSRLYIIVEQATKPKTKSYSFCTKVSSTELNVTDIYPNLKEEHKLITNSIIDDLDNIDEIHNMITNIIDGLTRVIVGESLLVFNYGSIDLSPPTLNYNIFISLFEGLMKLSTDDSIITLSVLSLQGNKCYDLLNLNSSKQTIDIIKNADIADYRNNITVKLETLEDFEQVNHIITNNINIVEMSNTKQKITSIYYLLSIHDKSTNVTGKVGFVLMNNKAVTPVGSPYFVSLYHVLHSVLSKASFIPYRDSKFTYFLQPLLSNCTRINFITNFPSIANIPTMGGLVGLIHDLQRCLKNLKEKKMNKKTKTSDINN